MAEHPHIALVRKGYEALARGDMEAMSRVAAGNVAFHIPGQHPLAGDYEGLDASGSYYRRLAEETDTSFRVELQHLFTNGRGRVIAIHRTTAERGDKQLDQLRGTIFTIVDDQVVDIDQCDEDIYGSDDFWG
jgi:ketosteroid isomerase-like protein